MVEKKHNWAKEVKSGLFLALILFVAATILFFLSFFDQYTLTRLRLNEAKMYADKMYRQESLRAQALFDNGEIEARGDLLKEYHAAVVDFNRSCSGGITAYWRSFGGYWKRYLSARHAYNVKIALLNKESASIRDSARKTSEEIMRQARAEIDPLFLVFKEKVKGKIKGYFYDPANGKLEPQVGVIAKKRVSDEKK